MQQTNDLLQLYPDLHIISVSVNRITLSGHIMVNRISKGYTLCKKYQIEIIIPILSDDLPFVLDIGHHIDESYPHRYTDGTLCLETDTCIRVRFVNGFSLPAWMSEYVEPYYFSYEYYNRYGEFPFGERGHGLDGMFQTYDELFEETDPSKVLNLMASITTQRYRGHMLCPCGSQKKLRLCHGKATMKYYTDTRLKKIVLNDYLMIKDVLKEYDEQRRYPKKTKR